MKRQETLKILEQAKASGFAVPHFNFAGYWDLYAIMQAAKEENAPIFVASLPKVALSYSPELLHHMVADLRDRIGCTAIHHLDHSTDIALCKRAVDAGYDSVMIDASQLSLEENIAAVSEVAAYAHAHDCLVEGEIGKIKGREGDVNTTDSDFLVQTADAAELVKRSNVDTLAIGIGTQHGFYRGEPEINFDRLREVAHTIQNPLVLHGGTGIPYEDVRQSIQGGISKVNVGTILRFTYLTSLREEIEKHGAGTHPLDLIVPAVTDKVKEVAREWIRTCMAQGHAL